MSPEVVGVQSIVAFAAGGWVGTDQALCLWECKGVKVEGSEVVSSVSLNVVVLKITLQ